MTPKQASVSPAIKLVIDGISNYREVVGWAYVIDFPARRVQVSIIHNRVLIASGEANILRRDVSEAGFGDGQSGFSIRLPKYLFDGCLHVVSICAEAAESMTSTTEIGLHFPLAKLRNDSIHLTTALPTELVPFFLEEGVDGPTGVYVPGNYVMCVKPHRNTIYHKRGWCSPEEEFTWINGIESVIEVFVRRPIDHYKLYIDVVPSEGKKILQSLEIFFNFFRVGYFEIPGPARLIVELPSELFIFRNSHIRLVCINAVVPEVSGDLGNVDTRRLGVAISGWYIA